MSSGPTAGRYVIARGERVFSVLPSVDRSCAHPYGFVFANIAVRSYPPSASISATAQALFRPSAEVTHTCLRVRPSKIRLIEPGGRNGTGTRARIKPRDLPCDDDDRPSDHDANREDA